MAQPKRKYWDTDENVFKTRSNTSWKYEPFDNKEVDMVDIFAAVQKYTLHHEVKTSKGRSKGNKLFATYIYRAMVEEEKYDGNAGYYKDPDGYKEPKKAWEPVDKAIRKYNNHASIKGTNMVIKMKGKLVDYSKSKGAKLTDEGRMAKLLEELKPKK